MKKLISGMLAAVMAASLMTVPNVSAEELTGTIIYVSPSGNDANDGSENSPLATMKGARDKVRQIKSAGMPANGITVAFREGSYKWTDTLEFTAEDSGEENAKIVYRSYPGEKAVFEAGIRIPGSEFTAVTNEDILMRWSNAKAKENIRQLDIKSYMAKAGYTNISDYYTQIYDVYHFGGTYQGTPDEAQYGKKMIRRPIYSFDGEPALWLARYPNKAGGWYEDTNPLSKFLKTGDIVKNGGNTEPSTFKYSERKISKYAGYDDVYLFGHLFYLFYHDEAKIKIDAQEQTITTVGNLPLGIKSNMDYFIFNILDELDAPGEYYVDKATGMMYVYPNGDITKKTMNVSLFDKTWMIEMNGTSNITFSGLTFENSKGGGIYTGGGSNVRLEYCSFNNFGTMGVQIGKTDGLPYSDVGQALGWLDVYGNETGDDWWQKQYNYWMKDEHQIVGKNNGLYGCIINNTGNSAVLLAGGNLYKGEEANHYVEECIIENVANYKRTYAAAINVRGCGFIIKNNRLGHCPASLINGNTSVALIQGNELYDGMSESNDNALIYLNYQYPNLDVKFIDNYFHDTVPEHEIKSSSSMFSQRSAIAFDNSYGGGVEFTNNVFVNIPRGNFLKNNEKINNNVYVDCFTPIQVASGVTNTEIDIPNPITEESVAPLHQYTQFFLSWPIFAGGDIGEKVNKEWRARYPVLMDWVDIVKSGAAEEKNFYEAKNNLIVNKSTPLHNGVTKITDENKYHGSMRHEISNNVYTDSTNMFVDYANRNYQLTPEASAQYGNTLNLSTVGPKTSMIGADKYAEAKVALPTAQGGAISTPSEKIPEKVKGAVVLKIGASDALANDKKVKVDPTNAAVMPQIINDRTLVPARFISESFGGEVGWDDATRTVTIKLGEKTVTMVLDKNELMIDVNVAAVMDVPAQSIEGRTMVPLRALCETALSKKVFWDPKGLIVISDKDNILDNTADKGTIDQILSILK